MKIKFGDFSLPEFWIYIRKEDLELPQAAILVMHDVRVQKWAAEAVKRK